MSKKIKRQALRREPYPFDTLKVGESLICTAKNKTSKYQIAKAATFRYPPKVFKAGIGEDGNARIWREA